MHFVADVVFVRRVQAEALLHHVRRGRRDGREGRVLVRRRSGVGELRQAEQGGEFLQKTNDRIISKVDWMGR